MTRQELKKEALQRMCTIGIYEPTVKQFEQDDLVSMSQPPVGACFWLDEKQQERVKRFEEKYNALVYHVIKSYLEDMEMDCYLYVSSNKEEWEYDHEDLKDNIALCYVENITEPVFSEFGSIGFKRTIAHGLVRTA